MIELTNFDECRDALKSRALRQALYDAGHRLMDGVIVNLDGDAHVARRRLENRLFSPETFAWYESDRLPDLIERAMAPAVASGRGDLPPMARRAMMAISAEVAGVDLTPNTTTETATESVDIDERFEILYGIMERLARASIVAHAVGDTDAIVEDGDRALGEFEAAFFDPSLDRRQGLLDAVEAGHADETTLPRDVLTTLLRRREALGIDRATILREVAYFPWVGSHSTSAQFVHSMHHVFEHLADRPEDREKLIDNPAKLQRFVHESTRLHPASPVAMRIATDEVELRSGRTISPGATVCINIEAANTDSSVFGGDAASYIPGRALPDGVAPWGLSFGYGTHACLGKELAAGSESGSQRDSPLHGAIVIMARALLRAGARPDPADPAELDPHTSRVMWGRYPVLLGREY